MRNSELLAPERQEAELNQDRKLKLFLRFSGKEERDRALKNIEDVRGFRDEFSRLNDFGPDTSPAHAEDGLALRFDKYDSQALAKIKDYFINNGFAVTESNQYIIEPAEQQKEYEQRERQMLAAKPKSMAKGAEVIELQSKKPAEPWEEEEAA